MRPNSFPTEPDLYAKTLPHDIIVSGNLPSCLPLGYLKSPVYLKEHVKSFRRSKRF